MTAEPRDRRAALTTLGCRLNQSESALLAAQLAERGWRIVPFECAADVVVINSCSVTADAEAACRHAVRDALRRSPGAFLVVTGCYAELGFEPLLRLPGVDLVVGNADKPRLAELLDGEAPWRKRAAPRGIRSRHPRTAFEQPLVGLHAGHTRAALKIQDGCDVGCSFCVIPRTRGGARSRRLADILREAHALAGRGHRELVLTGVNLGTWEDGGRSFADLLRALDAIPGLERVRISSIEPSTVSDAVLDAMAESARLCRHLHVPVQSGDDTVLERMRRPYRRADFDALLDRALSRMPDLGLGTDVMVGFPGEDDAAFERTLGLVTDARLAYLHVFSYSARPGTRAARMPGEVPAAVSRERSRCLRRVDLRLRAAFGRRFVGRPVPVLVENRARDGLWGGHTEQFVRVAFESPLDLANQLEPVLLERLEGTRWRAVLAA